MVDIADAQEDPRKPRRKRTGAPGGVVGEDKVPTCGVDYHEDGGRDGPEQNPRRKKVRTRVKKGEERKNTALKAPLGRVITWSEGGQHRGVELTPRK